MQLWSRPFWLRSWRGVNGAWETSFSSGDAGGHPSVWPLLPLILALVLSFCIRLAVLSGIVLKKKAFFFFQKTIFNYYLAHDINSEKQNSICRRKSFFCVLINKLCLLFKILFKERIKTLSKSMLPDENKHILVNGLWHLFCFQSFFSTFSNYLIKVAV